MKPDIKFETVGEILEGTDLGQYIKVHHDKSDTGGFYIFQSSAPTFDTPETYDAWVESRVALDHFFVESGWKIRWLLEI